MDLVFFVRRKKGSMERVVDLPCFGESELVGDGGEDFDNCEGSFTFGGKFGVCDGAFEISGFEPDFVSFGKGGESSVVTRGHYLAGEFVGGEGFVSSSDEGLKTGFYCGDRGVGDQGREGMRFISHHEVEWRLVRDGMGVVIVGKFSV